MVVWEVLQTGGCSWIIHITTFWHIYLRGISVCKSHVTALDTISTILMYNFTIFMTTISHYIRSATRISSCIATRKDEMENPSSIAVLPSICYHAPLLPFNWQVAMVGCTLKLPTVKSLDNRTAARLGHREEPLSCRPPHVTSTFNKHGAEVEKSISELITLYLISLDGQTRELPSLKPFELFLRNLE